MKTGQSSSILTRLPNLKILLIKFRSLGDTVLLTAPLEALKKAHPNAEIHVAVLSDWAALLEGHPSISRLWSFNQPSSKTQRAGSLARLALQLHKEKFDCVFNFHASTSSSLLAFSTQAPHKAIHFHGHQDKDLFSTVPIPDKGQLKPIIERDMDTLRALQIKIPKNYMPRLWIKENENQNALQKIKQFNLKFPILGLGIGSSRPTKSWCMDRFAMTAVEWVSKTQGGVLAFFGQNETELAHHFMKELDDALTFFIHDRGIRAQTRNSVIIESGLPLRELSAEINQCAVFLGNDSGPKHIAAALDCPTVTLFGPEHPTEWHPYPKDQHPYFFIEGLDCRKEGLPQYPKWCSLSHCIEEKHQCMKKIGIDEVLAECLRVMKK